MPVVGKMFQKVRNDWSLPGKAERFKVHAQSFVNASVLKVERP